MEPQYAVIGIHGSNVPTVNKTIVDENGNELIEQRNVARVRMFINDQMIDEDFNLPAVITVEEQIAQAVNDRIREIMANGVDAPSKVIPEQTEQIIAEVPSE